MAAAWELVREQGLAALSMRELGARVGMRAQSLYGYFAAKEDIYDAMFRQGYEEFVSWMAPLVDTLDDAPSPIAAALATSQRFFEFCTSDPARYQLLFQRTVPGFEPSAESYAVAVAALNSLEEAMARLGVTDPAASDLWTAVLTGLTDQQVSNDPGGDRWQRLLERAVHMLLVELAPQLLEPDTEPEPDPEPDRTEPRR